MRKVGRHAGVVAFLQRRLGSDVVHRGRGEEPQATVVTLNVVPVVTCPGHLSAPREFVVLQAWIRCGSTPSYPPQTPVVNSEDN
jgi:hypothetical protein